MKKTIIALLVLSAVSAAVSCSDKDSLPRAQMGDTAQFDSVFFDVSSIACDELHSLMILKDGKVIYENYDHGYGPDHLHVMWSASKTFTATAVGFAAQDGLLELTDKVVDYFSDEELPDEPSEWLRKMTLYDLIIMSSGFKDDCVNKCESGKNFDWAKETLASEIIFEPGTRFAYNSMDTYLLSVVVSRVTGKRVDDYLDEKLFRPLGISEYRWKISPQNYAAGGWGLYLHIEDFAKMGLFMMQKGVWEGKRLLNEEWFDEAMSAQIMQYAGQGHTPEEIAAMEQNDWNQGYGYQMWMCRNGGCRLDGAWGQICVIYPEKNLVVAAHSHTYNTRELLNSIVNRVYSQF